MANRFLKILLFCVFFWVSAIEAAEDHEFLMGAGDVISIDVYNEPDLNVRAKIGRSGKLRIPLLGDIQVAGKTASQLSTELEAKYFDGYLVNPSVAVVVVSFRPFYIRGAVKTAGSYDFEFDLTVDQAIAVAGGLKDRASRDEWFIIREPDKKRFKVDKNTLVLPGDIIEIKESLF